jgi:hypothetical protein
MLAESNCRVLGVNFINTCSEIQQAEVFDGSSPDSPPLVKCTWYKDIIHILQELKPPNGMGKTKSRDLKLKEVRYFLIN